MVKSAVEYTMAKNLIASWHLVDNIAKWWLWSWMPDTNWIRMTYIQVQCIQDVLQYLSLYVVPS